jgi:hypothetical protein
MCRTAASIAASGATGWCHSYVNGRTPGGPSAGAGTGGGGSRVATDDGRSASSSCNCDTVTAA